MGAEAMSERMTEAELLRMEASAREYGDAVGDSCGECGADLLVPPLIAEVRRLRGIIVEMAGVEVDGTTGGFGSEGGTYCISCTVDHDREACPTRVLEAEIGAIREEQGRG